jgi:hypothetical protein
MTPFGRTSSSGSGSYALALAVDSGALAIVGQPPPLSATVQVDKNPPLRAASRAPVAAEPA